MEPDTYYVFNARSVGWITPAFGTTTRPPKDHAKIFTLHEALIYCSARYSEEHINLPVNTKHTDIIESLSNGN